MPCQFWRLAKMCTPLGKSVVLVSTWKERFMLKCFLQGAKEGSLDEPVKGKFMESFLKDNAYGDNAAAADGVCTKNGKLPAAQGLRRS